MKYIEKGVEPEQFILWKAQEAETLEAKYINCEKKDGEKGKISADKIWKHLPSSKKEQPEEGIVYYDKEALKATLLQEQGKICCYCGKRIDLKNADIEHFELKSLNPRKTFDYHNLWASCKEPIYDYLQSDEKTWEVIAQRVDIDAEILEKLNVHINLQTSQKGDKIKIREDLHCNQERGDNKKPIISPADKDCEDKFTYKISTNEKGINFLEISGLTDEAKNSTTVLNLNTNWLGIERYKTHGKVPQIVQMLLKKAQNNPVLLRQYLEKQTQNMYLKNDGILQEFCFIIVFELKKILK